MEYICRHCGADLDQGDVFDFFMKEYGDKKKALENAGHYGWTPTNRVHFKRSLIIQPSEGPQYVICPDCEGIDPLLGDDR